MAVARQRPATANGIVFMLLEDEHGQVNLIVPPPVYERYRAIVRGEPLLLARGTLERHDRNVNLLVVELVSLGPLAREAASEAEVHARAPARPPLRAPLAARLRLTLRRHLRTSLACRPRPRPKRRLCERDEPGADSTSTANTWYGPSGSQSMRARTLARYAVRRRVIVDRRRARP